MAVLSKNIIEQTVRELYDEMREYTPNDIQAKFIRENYVDEQVDLTMCDYVEKLEHYFESFEIDVDLADEMFAWTFLDRIYDRIHERQKNRKR